MAYHVELEEQNTLEFYFHQDLSMTFALLNPCIDYRVAKCLMKFL